MDALLYFVLLAASGLVVGALGRLALPGPDPMTIGETTAVGLAATLIAGLVAWGVLGREESGVILSVLVSTGIVYLVRRRRASPAPADSET